MEIHAMADPVLAVGAHPEDIDIHAGGTVAQLIEAGQQVSYILCTSGNRGTDDPSLTLKEVAAIREREQREAASILGVEDVTFLRHDDADLQYVARELREQIVRLIRQKHPRTIITHDPYPGDGSHDTCAIYPDHLAVGRTVFEAAYICAPGPLFYPEHLDQGLTSHKPEVIYLIMSQHPDAFVDIAPVWEQKMRAVQTFESQGRHLPEVPAFFRGIAEDLGQEADMELAEGFRTLLPG